MSSMGDNNIQVISTCSIGKATPNVTCYSISRVDLTPWDLQLLLLDPIQKGILFYKPESPSERLEFEKTFIQHLKATLSDALDFFPPLAGRFSRTTNDDNTSYFHMECNNAGASFTHAIAPDVHVSDILDSVYTPNFVSSLFSLNGASNYKGVSHPLLAVQVTEFIDGFFVGCTMNHSVGDGTSFWLFLNSWSEISRGLDKIQKLPDFERSPDVFYPFVLPVAVPPFELEPKDETPPPPLLERAFSFSKQNLSKLKARANSEAGIDTISTLQALLAHIWRAVMRCRGIDPKEEVSCILVVGTRARLTLPNTYFGNALYFASATVKNENLMSNGHGWAALELNKVVAKQTSEEAKSVLENLGKNLKINKKGGLMNRNKILISSSPRHNVYGVDFGWGKPVAVRSGKAQKYDGKITVYPGAETGGIDVEACLSPETLVALGDDAEFMEAVTF